MSDSTEGLSQLRTENWLQLLALIRAASEEVGAGNSSRREHNPRIWKCSREVNFEECSVKWNRKLKNTLEGGIGVERVCQRGEKASLRKQINDAEERGIMAEQGQLFYHNSHRGRVTGENQALWDIEGRKIWQFDCFCFINKA